MAEWNLNLLSVREALFLELRPYSWRERRSVSDPGSELISRFLIFFLSVAFSPPISPHFALRPTLREAFLSNFLLSVSSLWVQSLDSVTESFINNFLPLTLSHFVPAVCERHSNFQNPYFTDISSSLLRFPPNLSLPLSLFLRSCYSTCLETVLVSLLSVVTLDGYVPRLLVCWQFTPVYQEPPVLCVDALWTSDLKPWMLILNIMLWEK